MPTAVAFILVAPFSAVDSHFTPPLQGGAIKHRGHVIGLCGGAWDVHPVEPALKPPPHRQTALSRTTLRPWKSRRGICVVRGVWWSSATGSNVPLMPAPLLST